MAAKMFVVFALLALCSSATAVTLLPSYVSPMMALGAMNPCQQYCMTQQAFTTVTPRLMPATMALAAMNPCMQNCMMQQVFTRAIQGQLPQMMAMGAMNPCMQYCMTQQAFNTRSLASPAMMLQQQLAFPIQQYLTPMMMSSTMSYPQCHCGAFSQVMQQPFMFNPMATTIPPMFFQQPIVGAPF